MGTKRSNCLALLTAALFVATGLLAATAQEPHSTSFESTERSVDFPAFMVIAEEAMRYRQDRLVSLDTFRAMAAEDNTIILDTRSAKAFAVGHISGAINLTFSDFTELKLADKVPSRDTRILIYCNNNFADNAAPVPTKSPALALNVPTFINLYGYGYLDIYELGERMNLDDPRLGWVSDADPIVTADIQQLAP